MTDVPAEVYARIAALEAQVAYLAHHLGLAPPPADRPDPIDEVVRVLRTGKKIAAIKRHRELFGSSLADAKRAVDDLEHRGLA